MKRTLATGLGLVLLACSAAPLLTAQPPRKSPHETAEFVLAGKKISITYGRPFKKGRQIFGGLEPLGKVWRTGADEATTITLAGDVMLGPLHVVAGTYSLFTIPEEGKWTIILNKTVKQWGAFKYDQAQDYGRAEMKVAKASSPVEQFTITIEKKDADSGTLKLSWDDTVATIPIMMH